MRLFLCLFSAVLAVFSLLKMNALNSYENAKSLYLELDTINNPSAVYNTELASEVYKASNAPFATNLGEKLEASYLMDLAKGIQDPASRIRAYCRAFTILSDVVKEEPYDAKASINWLDVQQITQNSECGKQLSEEDRKSLIEKAVKNDPTNTNVLYSAGLLYVWANQSESALPLFHNVLRLSTKLSTGHQTTILGLIDSKERFEKIVPPRFPQIITWTNLLREKNPEVYKNSLDVVEKMQMMAIGKSLAEMQSGVIPAKIHLNNLESMLKTAATDDVRKLTYEYIADLIGLKSELGEYFKDNIKLTSIPITKASKTYDSLPYKGALSDWNSDKDVVFDTNETSVGFKKEKLTPVKYVELVSAKMAKRINPGELRFFTSDDNQIWTEVTLNYRQLTNPNIDKTYLIVDIKSSDFKYFKVSFHSPVKKASFFNKGSQIVNVYG